MKKQLGIAAAGLVGLTAGAGVGLVLTGGSSTSAAQGSPTTSPTAPSPNEAPAPTDDRTSKLEEVLAPLVKNGTITQSQADAVIKALEDARPKEEPGDDHGFPGRFRGGLGLDAAASAIGIPIDDLLSALRSGQTIAAVAKAHGVDTAKVVDAMVAAYTKRVQDAVTNGRETKARADAEIAGAKDRITALVNGARPFGGHSQGPKTTDQTG